MQLPNPLRILVADDSPVVRAAVGRKATAAGFVVVFASSFADASRHASEAFDGALLDLDLGDGDGATLGAALRANSTSLAIAFFSGGAQDDVRANALALGPVFAKPDDLDGAIAWLTNATTSRRRP